MQVLRSLFPSQNLEPTAKKVRNTATAMSVQSNRR